MALAKKIEHWDGTPIARERWGRDHTTTFLYLETCVVDRTGRIEWAKMRSDGAAYGSRLADDTELKGHNDYDCIHDFAIAGLVTDVRGRYALTDAGWEYAGKLRRARAEDWRRRADEEGE